VRPITTTLGTSARSASAIQIFRNAGLYPLVDAPLFNREGGDVGPGFNLVMSAGQGTIYYTTNGTDPRTPIEIEELKVSDLSIAEDVELLKRQLQG